MDRRIGRKEWQNILLMYLSTAECEGLCWCHSKSVSGVVIRKLIPGDISEEFDLDLEPLLLG
jgi:hypothetical protein